MITSKVSTTKFTNDLNNIIEYSLGFLDGVQKGKPQFLTSLGVSTIEMLKNYIDSSARTDPQLLGHMYEWNQIGDASSRLYNLDFKVLGSGLTFGSTFRQSSSIKDGSNVPFYDKARIMEYGIPVTIKPRKSEVLAFTVGDEEVFTRNPVNVNSPGGEMAKGGFEKTVDEFFSRYFSQSFLRVSGIVDYLEKPTAFNNNLAAGKRGGRNVGVNTGYKWIAKAGVGL
jgi:hypothetical protein